MKISRASGRTGFREACRSRLVRVAGVCTALCWLSADAWAQIAATVSSDQTSYTVGEPIEITITAVNHSAAPIILTFPSSLQSQYILDGSYVNNQAGLAIFTDAVIPANGTYDWKYYHRWDDYTLSAGSHEAIGNIVGYATSALLTFDVIDPEPVTRDVFIDFETLPDGTPINGIWQSAYAAWGVELRSDGGGVSLIKDSLDSTTLYSPSGSHPFNIVAEFDMNVYRVSADVGSAANCTVNMFAFDAAGNLLGVVASDPTPAYRNLAGQLEFSSITPIASVKWISSNPLAAVLVDNLHIRVGIVPEASSFILALVGVLAYLITGKRRSILRTQRRATP
jgi:hypothetical protein